MGSETKPGIESEKASVRKQEIVSFAARAAR
jgi:hypothetical protein